MSYTQPEPKNIVFDFTESYTPPLGNAIEFKLLGEAPLYINFNFRTPDYEVPSDIIFWFGAIQTISFADSIINTTSNLNVGQTFNINSSIATISNLESIEDYIISLSPSIINTSTIAVFFSDAWYYYTLTNEAINTQSIFNYGYDIKIDLENSVINTNSLLDCLTDEIIELANSIITTSQNFSVSIDAPLKDSIIETVSQLSYIRNVKNDFIHIVGIGTLDSNCIYINKVNEVIYINHIYKNGMSVLSNNIYVNSTQLHINHLYKNDIFNEINNNIIYNNTFNNIIANDNIYKVSYYLNNDNIYKNDIFINILDNNIFINNVINNIANNFIYKNGIIIYNDYLLSNSIDINLTNNFIFINDLSAQKHIDCVYNNIILDYIEIIDNCKYSNIILNKVDMYSDDIITAYINNTEIEFVNINLSIHENDYSYSFSGEISTIENWLLCQTNSILHIYLNSNYYQFIITSRTRNREFNNEIYTIEALSKTYLLSKDIISKEYSNVLASFIISDLCNELNIEYEYNMLDWYIPILQVSKETYISVIQKIADACGGIVYCNNVGKLILNTKYKKSPILYNTSVGIFSDYNNIFSISENKLEQDNWNSVVVSNINESSDYSYSIQEITDSNMDSNTVKHIRIKVYPFLQNIDLFTSYIDNNIKIVSLDNPITKTIEDEVIEIIEGKGSVSESIKSIVNYEYLNIDLGTLIFDNNNIHSQFKNTSLIKITYITEYHDYLVYDNITDIIQVYTTDENEVI